MIKINNQTRVIIINNCLISLEGCLPKSIECSKTKTIVEERAGQFIC